MTNFNRAILIFPILVPCATRRDSGDSVYRCRSHPGGHLVASKLFRARFDRPLKTPFLLFYVQHSLAAFLSNPKSNSSHLSELEEAHLSWLVVALLRISKLCLELGYAASVRHSPSDRNGKSDHLGR